MKFFSNARVSDVEQSPLSILRQFSIELDHKLTEQGLRIINGSDLELIEFMREIDAHQAQLGRCLNEIHTPTGLILTDTKYLDCLPHDLPITISKATTAEIDAHYKKIAAVTLQRKTTNCVGLAAVALLLSEDLLKSETYNKIQVQICYLLNWGHVFVRFKHADEAQGLFYDPWFQRCQTKTPGVPVLIQEHEFHEKMRQMVSLVYNQGKHTISLTRYFHNFDPKTMQLSEGVILNINSDYGYGIIHSSTTIPPCADKITDSCIIS